MEKPIFIFGSHKSGTSLLRNLLDGTPKLFVVPIETHFFQYSGYWVDYALRSSLPKKIHLDNIIGNFTRHIQKSNHSTNFSSDSVMAGIWNVDAFTQNFKEKCRTPFDEQNTQQLFVNYIDSIHMALYGTPLNAKRFVEKSVENAEYACYLHSLFPDAKFIHIIRNPFATIVSMRKHVTNNQSHYPYLLNLIASLKNSYYYLYKNPPLIDNYLTIRYEDLVADPESVMKNIASFIEIQYSDDLLTPTSMGSPWKGNSTTNKEIHGISNSRVNAWKKEIFPLEAAFINLRFTHVLRDHMYNGYTREGNIYLPAPKERLFVYFANRFYWLTSRRLRSVNI